MPYTIDMPNIMPFTIDMPIMYLARTTQQLLSSMHKSYTLAFRLRMVAHFFDRGSKKHQ